jgi:hypothetical protein
MNVDRKWRWNTCSLLVVLGLVWIVPAQAKIPVILSTDVGNEIDDQWAIAYLLTNPEFEVLSILSAQAPSVPAPSAHYTYLMLRDEVENQLRMFAHPPLFEGSSLPLVDTKTPRRNAGVDFIVQSSESFTKDNRLTVFTIGAATDVASAILEDPSIVDRIQVVAMGFESWPKGGDEYNVVNDVNAWQVIMQSSDVRPGKRFNQQGGSGRRVALGRISRLVLSVRQTTSKRGLLEVVGHLGYHHDGLHLEDDEPGSLFPTHAAG